MSIDKIIEQNKIDVAVLCFSTKESLLNALKSLPPDKLVLVGFVLDEDSDRGRKGDVTALRSSDLK